jgi:hypothetical protein
VVDELPEKRRKEREGEEGEKTIIKRTSRELRR